MSTHNAIFQCLLEGQPHSIHIAYSLTRDERDDAWMAFLRVANKLGRLSSVKLRKVEEL